MRKLVPNDKGKLRIGTCKPQHARIDDDAIVCREGIQRGVRCELDRNCAGLYRSHRVHFVDAVAADKNLYWSITVVAHKSTNPSRRAAPWNGLIVKRQKVVAGLDSGDGRRRCFGHRQYGRLSPAEGQSFVRERPIFAWQARDSARVQTDLCPCPVFTVVAVGDTETERDVMKAADLSEVVANLIDLLFAPFGFDVVRRKRR